MADDTSSSIDRNDSANADANCIQQSGTFAAVAEAMGFASAEEYWKAEAQDEANAQGREICYDLIDLGIKVRAKPNGTTRITERPIDETTPEDEQAFNDDDSSTRTENSAIESANRSAEILATSTSDADDNPNASIKLPGTTGFEVSFKVGAARTLGGLIPSMESILLNIPNQLIGKFMQGLPAEFQALLPAGAVEGIVGSVINTAIGGGTVSLNNLLRSIAGVAIGSVANQALRSLQGSISIPIVSEISGSLGAIALNRIAQEIPLDATGNLSTNTNLSQQTGAVLASVIGTVTTNILTKASQGIPIDPNVISAEVNITLGNLQTNIPIQILGVTTNIISSVISNAFGGIINGSVPIIPANLSLSFAGSVAGIGINISANLAQNIIPSFQLQAILPANLQNAIPRIPPRLSGDYVLNRVEVNRSKASEVIPNGERPQLEEKQSTLDPLTGKRLIGNIPISKNFTIASVTTNTRLCKSSYPRGSPKLSVPEIYENLKFLAENVLEKVNNAFPGMMINCGLRTPRPKEPDTSYHNKGLAVDLQWDDPNFNSMAERANWMYTNIAALKELLLETRGASHGDVGYWIHVAVEPGYSGTPKAETWYTGSGKKIPYNNGFVKGSN